MKLILCPIALGIIVILLSTASVLAQAPAQQQQPEFVKQGQQLMRAGKPEEALALYRQTLHVSERARLEAIAEAFNLLNNLNVTDINTVYEAANFIGPQPRKLNDKVPAPSADYGSIRAIAPPSQIQLALRV